MERESSQPTRPRVLTQDTGSNLNQVRGHSGEHPRVSLVLNALTRRGMLLMLFRKVLLREKLDLV